MGQQFSISRKSRRKSRKLFSSQFFIGNNTLSHTFAVFDDEPIANLININSASENELLKVREIDLELSKNIVKHRRTIGYFQKVEDLVVVPGMGAERLDRIKHQVCTNSKNGLRCSLQSFDSLKSVDSRTTITRSNKLVNVNQASIFELQLVHGITQEIAAGIVHYRNKKGPFKKLEDLRKIKCIDYIRLDNICRFLTVENDEDDFSENEKTYQDQDVKSNGYIKLNGSHLKSFPANGYTNGMPASIISDLFELLSAYSTRPIVNELFKYSRNDRPAFRIASWNLEDFSVAKASNLGVKEVVCRTILENGWSILAVQNVEDENALKLICDELNEPKLHRVEEWRTNSRHWKFTVLEMANEIGFIYDAAEVNGTKLISSEKGPPELDTFCATMISNFEINQTKIQILNMKLKANINVPEIQGFLEKLMDSKFNYVICCDSSYTSNNIGFANGSQNCKVIISTDVPNNINSRTNFSHHTSNFYVSTCFQKHFTGLNGIVRNGLTHLAIPSGWNWGGPISSSCPIWTEFYVNAELNL